MLLRGQADGIDADPGNRVPERDKPEGAAYDTNVHPEYQERGGKIMYVTFSRSNHKGWFGSEFALVKVVLP